MHMRAVYLTAEERTEEKRGLKGGGEFFVSSDKSK
jgi:hypothetical protein